MQNSTDRLRAILVLASTIATIVFNFLAATGRINGVLTSEVSERYTTVITPAGYAFSIWGLIYVGMIAFSIYQLLPSKNDQVSGVRTAYLISCVFNCAWILSWHHYHIGLCVILIFALLAALIFIVAKFREPGKLADALLTKAVFGVYAGWVTAASLVNLMIFVRASNMELSPFAWNTAGIACIFTAAICSVLVRWKLRNFLYPIAAAWALTAIAVKQSGNTGIVVASAFATIICLVNAGSIVVELKDSTSE